MVDSVADFKPSLGTVMSQAQLEKKVADYLRKSQALEDYWQRPITGEQLQAETDRMAKHTKQPDVLRELFEALGNDPFVIAECLARPALAIEAGVSLSEEPTITEIKTGVMSPLQQDEERFYAVAALQSAPDDDFFLKRILKRVFGVPSSLSSKIGQPKWRC
jgi:hypothetical protein